MPPGLNILRAAIDHQWTLGLQNEIVSKSVCGAQGDNAAGLVLTINKMQWRCFQCHCHDFRFYVTLFPKCFSNFRSRYLFDIGLPTLYLTLADKYLPLDTAFPNSATLFVLAACEGHTSVWMYGVNGLTPSMAQYSQKGLWWFSNGFALRIEFRHSPPHSPMRRVRLPQLKAL